jgi:hypothetical protein
MVIGAAGAQNQESVLAKASSKLLLCSVNLFAVGNCQQ